MTDRELLELAAKAVGLHDLTYFDEGAAGGKGMRRNELDWDNWNPLENDGDALRLAVTLRLNMIFPTAVGNDEIHVSRLARHREMLFNDPFAATRRAIVRAAAEIGRAMK